MTHYYKHSQLPFLSQDDETPIDPEILTLASQPYLINIKNEDGETILHTVAKRGQLNNFKYLVSHGADPYATTNDGRNVLHYAALGKNLDLVKYVTNTLGINPNQVDNYGLRPIHYLASIINGNQN